MITAFLLAAGKSTRFGENKLWQTVRGEPIFVHSLRLLSSWVVVDRIVVVVGRHDLPVVKKTVKKFPKVSAVVVGGATRFESVKKGVVGLPPPQKNDIFIFHNAANPCATEQELQACLKALLGKIAGAAVGRRLTSTIKSVHKNRIQKTLPRADLYAMETPQVVKSAEFLASLKKAKSPQYTDDLAVLEAAGHACLVVEASDFNRKITTPADMAFVREFFGDVSRDFRVGVGEDSHRFTEKKNGAHLGGVLIKNLHAFDANSDGDVILHALCNAISSALGLKGSLGSYATKMCNAGITDSREYLKVVLRKMHSAGYQLSNCSLSIEGARPRIDPLAPKLKKSLGALLTLPAHRIGITATSGEDLTPFGRGEGLKATAITILQR